MNRKQKAGLKKGQKMMKATAKAWKSFKRKNKKSKKTWKTFSKEHLKKLSKKKR